MGGVPDDHRDVLASSPRNLRAGPEVDAATFRCTDHQSGRCRLPGLAHQAPGAQDQNLQMKQNIARFALIAAGLAASTPLSSCAQDIRKSQLASVSQMIG